MKIDLCAPCVLCPKNFFEIKHAVIVAGFTLYVKHAEEAIAAVLTGKDNFSD